MELLGAFGVFFVSVAVIIAIFGEFVAILQFLGLKREASYPWLAFGGVITVTCLLSAIVASVVAPGPNTNSFANNIANTSIWISFLPWAAALIQTFKLRLSLIGIPLFLIGPIFFVFAIYPLQSIFFDSLPTLAPLLFAVVFAIIPIVCAYLLPKKVMQREERSEG